MQMESLKVAITNSTKGQSKVQDVQGSQAGKQTEINSSRSDKTRTSSAETFSQ